MKFEIFGECKVAINEDTVSYKKLYNANVRILSLVINTKNTKSVDHEKL